MARRLAAEDALKHAHERGHHAIGTGHVLLALLEASDRAVDELVGGEEGAARLTAAVVETLPVDERCSWTSAARGRAPPVTHPNPMPPGFRRRAGEK